MGPQEIHYTASIEVVKVTPAIDTVRTQDKRERKVEQFRVTVRSNTLDKLKKKIKAHMDLIDVDDLKGE